MNLSIYQVLAAGIVAFGLMHLAVPLLIKLAFSKKIYDKPDGNRNVNVHLVPTLGGMAIFIAFLVGYSISGISSEFSGYPYFIASLVLLFVTGLKDDLTGLSPAKKLIVEVLAVSLLILGSGVYIDNFHGVFGIYELPYLFGILITFFTVIVVMNACNLIDGADGLASGLGVIASLFFGTGFYISEVPEMAIMAFILAIVLLGFLFYNFKPASIVMGDSGSLTIGFLLSVMAIQFTALNEVPAYTEWFGLSSSVLPVAILIVPLYDTIRIFYLRAKRKVSPFKPDKNHIHHEFMRMGFTHRGTALILYACSITITLLAVSISYLDVHFILAGTLISSVLLLPTNGTKRKLLSKMGIEVQFGVSQIDDVIETDSDEGEQLTAKSKSTTKAETVD